MILLDKILLIKDIIHDSIEISLIAKSIIDNNIFQRLRNLHQLGVCYMVFPNANNNRFEHSIGTYHLTGLLVNNLIKNSNCLEINKSLIQVDFIRKYLLKNFELEETNDNIDFLKNINTVLLDDYLVELIKIAGLTHDLGHGPFSHLFDEWLHNKDELKGNNFIEHEFRSIKLLKIIIDSTQINYNNEIFNMNEFIDDKAYDFISELINPTKQTPNNFVFQIISNSMNGLDVDKLDYLYRDSFYLGSGKPFDLSRIISHVKVINNNINFPEKISYDLYKVYRSRYDLHKQFYNHKTVISIQYMIRDILENLNEILNITENIKNNDFNKFIELIDSTLINSIYILKNIPFIRNKYLKNIENIEKINNMINERKLYNCLYSTSYYTEEIDNINLNNEIDNFILSYEKKNDITIDKNLIIPIKLKIGLLSGNKTDPFDNLYFYDNYNNSFNLEKKKISYLISPFFQEIIFHIFYKSN